MSDGKGLNNWDVFTHKTGLDYIIYIHQLGCWIENDPYTSSLYIELNKFLIPINIVNFVFSPYKKKKNVLVPTEIFSP